MKKLKLFLNFEREEAWLNQMADSGHLLARRRLRYGFRDIVPGSAVVRIDYRPGMSISDHADYLTLFADAGWHHLDGARSGGAQYFASFAAQPDAEIFSDAESTAARYRRAISFRLSALIAPAVILMAFLPQQGFDVGGLADLRAQYLTPGLWEMQGAEFAARLAFETPFALVRAAGPALFVWPLTILCAITLAQAAYQYRLYRRATASSGPA